jgi:hypothetical protein
MDKYKAPFEVAFSNMSELGFLGTLLGVAIVLSAAANMTSSIGEGSTNLYKGMDTAIYTSIHSTISVLELRTGVIIKSDIKKEIALQIARAIYKFPDILKEINRNNLNIQKKE